MEHYFSRLKSRNIIYLLWITMCFGLTSAVYLSWLDRLLVLGFGPAADWITMVAGYLLQAAGTGILFFLQRRNRPGRYLRSFFVSVILFAVVMVPALISESPAGAVCFGLVMNLLCGTVAGFYLLRLLPCVRTNRRALVFGGGYAAATIAVGILALIENGSLLHGRPALPIYLIWTVLLLFLTVRYGIFEDGLPENTSSPACKSATSPKDVPDSILSETTTQRALDKKLLAISFTLVILISAVKNLGFSFPSEDIAVGLIPEISRLPYAAGLLAAGFVHDKDRKNGMLCTIAALIIPFIMLGLSGEPISRSIFWGLDYLFYGFFSVFRVVLFLDLADRACLPVLSLCGLLAGRLGDACGTAVSILLTQYRLALVTVTVLLFFAALFLFYNLYRLLYEPALQHQKSEQEVFETFCLHNDLSARERDIFRMVISGRTNGEIAEALFISENTVKYHVRNILQKTGCKNRNELQKKYTLALYPHL